VPGLGISRFVVPAGLTVLYIYTVLLIVYRLRLTGMRVDRLSLRQTPAPRGEFVYQQGPHEFWGKRPMFAKLLEPGTSRDLIPHLEWARICPCPPRAPGCRH
jgi:hypothetical protein